MVKKRSKRVKKRKKTVKKKSKAKKAKAKKKVAKKAKSKKKPAKKAKAKKKKAKKAVSTKYKAKQPKKYKIRQPFKKSPKKPSSAKKVGGKANMIVTFDPNHRGSAEAELKDAFKRISAPLQILGSELEGLFKVKTGNPKKTVRALIALCKAEPGMFNVTHKYIPIDVWCRSEIPDIQRTIKSFVKEIKTDEKWKMGLNKRRWDKMHGTQLILTLTDVIDRQKVDLVNPEKIVQVEIIEDEAGVSLLLPDEILEVIKLKGPVF